MNSTQKDTIIDLIERESDMTIATVSPDGQPLAATVSYVNDGLVLYFGTSSQSQKVRNIQDNDRVSLTINRPYRFWRDIEGLSVQGKAKVVNEPDKFRKASQLLFDKFPQVNDFARSDDEDVILIRIDPVEIAYLNYRKGFGHMEKVM